MKKILVADWLDAYGGAERVIKTLNKMYCFNKTYTLTCLMKEENLSKIYPEENPLIIESNLKIFKQYFRYFFFLFHYEISKLQIDQDVTLVISSSHSVAKGICKTHQDQLHISYFQARNFNYIWEDSKMFFGILKPIFFPLIYVLRKMDIIQAKNPDFIIANSIFVQDWIKERYNRESIVIYPPVDLSNFKLVEKKEDYYVAVGRIVTVKKFDILVNAFNSLEKKLVIIGDGANLKKLQKIAKSNIIFTGFLPSEKVNFYVSNAKGFIQPGVEGFGIATLEAQACGTPVIAYGVGGVLETVKNHKTGLFFHKQTKIEIIKAITTFETMIFDRDFMRKEALNFSENRFISEFTNFVDSKIQK